MFNMGLGYALPFFQVLGSGVLGLSMRPEVAISITKSRNGYILLSPQIQLIENFYAFLFTVGFQYDFPILVRGLFLYLRGSLGYEVGIAVSQSSVGDTILIRHYGLILPEAGFKYVVNGKVNFGFEPLGLPITFNAGGAQGSYRQMFYAGFNF